MPGSKLRVSVGYGIFELGNADTGRFPESELSTVIESDVRYLNRLRGNVCLVCWRKSFDGYSGEIAIRAQELHGLSGGPCLMIFMTVTRGSNVINRSFPTYHCLSYPMPTRGAAGTAERASPVSQPLSRRVRRSFVNGGAIMYRCGGAKKYHALRR